MTVNRTQATELENLVLDVLGLCAMLVLRIQKVGNSAHPATNDIEVYLIAAARAAADIDHFFADARGARDACISNRLH
jgi:hypothetical protein